MDKLTKSPSRKKLFHSAALYSFIWSIFYFIRVVVFAFTASDQSLLSPDSLVIVQWEVVECLLAVLGVLVSLALFNSYKTLIDNDFYTFGDRLNQIIDLAHILNAPATIYFILNFISLTCYDKPVSNGMTKKKRRIRRRAARAANNALNQLHKFEVHHLSSEIADEEVVYYLILLALASPQSVLRLKLQQKTDHILTESETFANTAEEKPGPLNEFFDLCALNQLLPPFPQYLCALVYLLARNMGQGFKRLYASTSDAMKEIGDKNVGIPCLSSE
ncbi:hypothetical protein WR25_01585 [Diploscapter pachys]|uniref:Uncharacterized protein n=1 Tax=Diploscapter pachys TaxID=2018661 RepID=A0A2A2KPW1_9BILA|nr:hypothetical protein WR25_01585 [Diploscapter pachys]